MSLSPILQIQNISKSFFGLKALQNVSFAVEQNSIVGLMGANGAGKTTLFSVIAGHTKADKGDVLLDGHSVVGERPDQVCRRGIARTFQIVRPFGGLTVLENVTTAAIFGSRHRVDAKEAARRAISILDDLDLADFRNTKARDLTLSRQKRLEVARALATGAKVLMLDEVMAGLTASEVNRMLAIIEEIQARRKLTILIIEHVMQALMRLSAKIVVLHLGEVVAEGTPEQITTNSVVHAIYFGKAH
jgi:branched-chain amino acid transport system ATP-binding protein